MFFESLESSVKTLINLSEGFVINKLKDFVTVSSSGKRVPSISNKNTRLNLLVYFFFKAFIFKFKNLGWTIFAIKLFESFFIEISAFFLNCFLFLLKINFFIKKFIFKLH